MQTLEISLSNKTSTFEWCFHLIAECIRKALTPALPVVDFRGMSLLYSKRMTRICLYSVSLSRHSISASLVPTDSPKRFGKLHKTQVGGRRLLEHGGLVPVQKRTSAGPLPLCPVLSCPGKLGDLRCWISVTSSCQSQRPPECGRFPIRHSSMRIKAVSLSVSSQTDSLFRAVIQKLRLLKTYLIRPECSVMRRSSIQACGWLCCHVKMQKFL